MKKVCFIVGQFPVVSQTFVVNQVVSAINNGLDVAIYTYSKQSCQDASQANLLTQYKLLDLTNQIDFKIPKSKIQRLLQGFQLSFKYFKYLKKAGLKNGVRLFLTLPFKIKYFLTIKNIDVFHVHFGHYGLDVALMKKIGVINAKLIVTFHGYDANLKNSKEQNNLSKQYQDLFLQSEKITVNTSYLKNILLQLKCNNDKIEVIPMGINTSLFKNNVVRKIDKNNIINLLSIGRLIELKGHHYAIHAVKELINNGFNINYKIIGVGNQKNELLKLIKELNITKNVVLVGKKSQEEIKEYFKKAHLFLMSSVKDSDNRCETQGIVTVEAQASGLPVVAFDSGGVKYTFVNNETGLLVKEKDTNAYANAIVKLIEDDILYSKLSNAAPEFVNKNFNIDKTSEKFIALYNQN
ncbi:glycosyltransferase [Olleya sp. R77988]|uniref:glycosyltransferase n=1 Tax=Olleya sp. R77988 TaxID=3093875 RepID=UPI0037C6CDEA